MNQMNAAIASEDEAVIVFESDANARAGVAEAAAALGLTCVIGETPASIGRVCTRFSNLCLVVDVSWASHVAQVVAESLDEGPTVPLIATLYTPVEEHDIDSLRSGAWDMLSKPLKAHAVRHGLQNAIEEARRRAADWRTVQEFRIRMSSLSADERAVLDAVCDGKLNKQIASELNISVRTVEQRRRRVFTKMDVASAVPLARRLEMVRTIERLSVSFHNRHEPERIYESSRLSYALPHLRTNASAPAAMLAAETLLH